MAESYVFMLKEFCKNDLQKYGQGIVLYAGAKAEFEGLIEMMKNRLINGKPFDGSDDFNNIVKTAVEKRISFTGYIENDVIGKQRGSKNPLLTIVSNASELIKAITDVGKTIWNEYRSVTDARKQELINQLETLKWKPFSEIGG